MKFLEGCEVHKYILLNFLFIYIYLFCCIEKVNYSMPVLSVFISVVFNLSGKQNLPLLQMSKFLLIYVSLNYLVVA